IAGAILITDGEVHDVPKDARALGFDAPVHAIVIGRKNEKDRRLTNIEAPRFGIVSETVKLSFRVDDTNPDGTRNGTEAGTVPVTISIDGKEETRTAVTPGQPAEITLPLKHGGPNVIEIA